MITGPDHQKISFTAKLVALGRKDSAVPFAQDVSELIGAADVVAELSGRTDLAQELLPPLMVPLLEARYLSLVSTIKRSGIRQVIEFASGVSLRGLAMTLNDPNLSYIETDLPDLTQEKIRLMDAVRERHHLPMPAGLHIATCNILHWEEIEPVLARLNPHEPVIVIHEGLLMYLSAHEKDIVAENIHRILDRFGGHWVTPDLSPMKASTPEEEAFWMEDAKFSDFMKAIESRTQRSFEENSFDSDEEVTAYCERHGFQVEKRLQIDGTYPLSRSGTLAPQKLERLSQGLKLWDIQVAKPTLND